MIDISVEVIDPGIVEGYIELLKTVPDFVNTVTSRTVNTIGPMILADLRREPGPSTQPIRWTTDRQRRFIMMQKSKGLMPKESSRTHAVSEGWRYRVIYEPGVLSSVEVVNAEESTEFVEGKRQQIFHADAGWLFAEDAVAPWREVLTDEIETDLLKAFYVGEDAGRNY